MRYFHVDVFSDHPLGGNGLAVCFPDHAPETSTLQNIAREFNQFETAFVYPESGGAWATRIFTVDEELPFAGHPLLGSAASIHRAFHSSSREAAITLLLGERRVDIASSIQTVGGRAVYTETMNQGQPSFLGRADPENIPDIAASFGLSPRDLDFRYPVDVVSTGLPYLLVPLASGLERAHVARADLESYLARFGAKFAYLFDTATLECRTWDNAGRVEDVATGSAAGPLCAWLVKLGLRKPDETIALSQGRFAGRPSTITGRVSASGVYVSGDVAIFAEGESFL
jgi:PhzF family phenazine biosynthesis protein